MTDQGESLIFEISLSGLENTKLLPTNVLFYIYDPNKFRGDTEGLRRFDDKELNMLPLNSKSDLLGQSKK